MSDPKIERTPNAGDEFPASRPGTKTTIGAVILLIGGIVIFYA